MKHSYMKSNLMMSDTYGPFPRTRSSFSMLNLPEQRRTDYTNVRDRNNRDLNPLGFREQQSREIREMERD